MNTKAIVFAIKANLLYLVVVIVLALFILAPLWTATLNYLLVQIVGALITFAALYLILSWLLKRSKENAETRKKSALYTVIATIILALLSTALNNNPFLVNAKGVGFVLSAAAILSAYQLTKKYHGPAPAAPENKPQA